LIVYHLTEALVCPPKQLNSQISRVRNTQSYQGKRASSTSKTFQCRGYGDCSMVFQRDSHLARHILSHTGEKPFECHCSQRFARLDNLRQHAQIVHSDQPNANARMMSKFGKLMGGVGSDLDAMFTDSIDVSAKKSRRVWCWTEALTTVKIFARGSKSVFSFKSPIHSLNLNSIQP
ncbi:hypothetical protein FB45DRAFT_735420, partial [Roridomyces roridus]